MIPLAVPNLTGNEKKYLDNCIETTFVSSVGKYVTDFESMVAEATGSDYAVATSAGTTGLHAALTAVGVKHGELVIIPSFTFIASANSVAHCGAEPWLMDVSADTWCLDPKLVEIEIQKNCRLTPKGLIHTATGKRVAAIMPVYTLGIIPDMKDFRRIADKYNLPLVADAACALGAQLEGVDFGELADLSVISFNGNKTVTCGGGGAVVGCGEELLKHVRHLTTTARVWPDYDFDEVGFNYRMTNIQAAVGCAQMERLSEFIESKRTTRKYYEKHLEVLNKKGVSFFPNADGGTCWFSGVVLPDGRNFAESKELCRKLKDAGIEGKTFWKPVHLQKPYAKCQRSEMSVSEGLWTRVITLPCSTGITEDELATVCNALMNIL